MNDSIQNLKQLVRDVPDFPKPGIMFKDISTLVKQPDAFRQCIDIFADRYRDSEITKVVGIESRGFIFASSLAYKLGWGLILARKPGKLPAKCIRESYDLEYGSDSIEMHCDSLEPEEQVLVMDDLIATGGTLMATCKLVEALGARVAEIATVVELGFLDGRSRLDGRPLFSIMKFS